MASKKCAFFDLAASDPRGVVDKILSSKELRNGLFRAVTESSCVPQNSRNETVEKEVSAVFRGRSAPVETAVPSTLPPTAVVHCRSSLGETNQAATQNRPMFQMRSHFATTTAKR